MSRIKWLIGEIHRRSLWQVLLIYCGAALVAYQAVQALTEGLGLPQWFPALAVVLFIVGLPIVLATAFVHEVAPPTVTPAEPTPLTEAEAARIETDAAAVHLEARRRHRFLTWRNAVGTFVIVLAAWGVVATGWIVFHEGAEEPGPDRKSVAVLPFANLSGNPGNEYFSDGITSDIINHLSKIADLRVISRTSVMQYKGTTKNLRQIGEELDVAAVVEGEVQQVGDRVRINAQLIDATTDEHLWAEQYNRELTDVFAIQSDVAQQIAAALRATLTPAERQQIERRPTDNLVAYDYYSRARHEYYKYTPEGHDSATALFEEALKQDETFAMALAGISLCQSQYFNRGWSDDEEWLAKAEVSAREALAIDPELIEAHFALGFVHQKRGNDEEAEREMKIVLEGNPNHAHAHDSLGDVYQRRGSLDRALAQYEIALRLDPFLVPALYLRGIVLRQNGRYEGALSHYQSVLRTKPDYESFHIGIGDVFREKGEHSAAVDAYEAALRITPHPDAFLGLARSLIALQDLTGARSVAERLLSVAPERPSMKAGYWYIIGHIDLARGDTENAIARFHEAAELQPSAVGRYIGREHQARVALAEANLARGAARTAVSHLEEVLRDHPAMLILRYHLGTAQEAAADTSKAVAEFRAFLHSWEDADPDAPALVDARRRLAALVSSDK